MLRFLRKRRSAEPDFEAAIETPRLIYAIGDVHGRHDLLERLLERVLGDAAGFDEVPLLVFMGDYIDRGDGSRQTIDLLIRLSRLRGVETVFLMGNHERMLLDFLGKPIRGEAWLRFGGRETLLSYGVQLSGQLRDKATALRVRDDLAEALGPHLEFVEALRLCHREGNLFFAHAGADPRTPLSEQAVQALLWGCPAFDQMPRQDGAWVVHGHTIVDQPSASRGRIAVDTGAYFSGRLTAARLHGGTVEFLST